MAARRKSESDHAQHGEARVRPAPVSSASPAASSPALELQGRLAAELDSAGRWHPLATLGFVVATCGGFWGLAAFAASRLIR